MQRWRRGGNGALLVADLVPGCAQRQFRALPSDLGQRGCHGRRGNRGWHRHGDAEGAVGRADPDRRGPEPRTDEHCADTDEGREYGHASPGAVGCAGLRDAGAEGPDSGSDSDAGAQGSDGRSFAGADRAAAGAERFAIATVTMVR